MEKELKKEIAKLREYFEKREDVVMAFLFGSRAKGETNIHESSDWDVAVYFKPEGGRIERDAQKRDFSEIRRNMWSELSGILETDGIDIVVLNQAHAPIAAAAINGAPLVIKSRRIYVEFMLIVIKEAYDFYQTAHHYYEIFSRSASLNEEDAVSLERRLAFLEAELGSLPKYKGISWQQYQSDDEKRKILEKTIENLVNATIDASQIVLASSRKPIPHSYRGILLEAASELAFSEKESQTFSGGAEVRNILAHEYLDYRWKDIQWFLENVAPLLPAFINEIKKFLEKNRT